MAEGLAIQFRSDPYRNFKFRVRWDGRTVAGVSKVSALKRTTEVIEVRDGADPAATRKVPGRTRFEPITLERGITRDREFEEWANAVLGGGAGLQNIRKNVALDIYNAANQLARTYKVHRAWVSMFQALPALTAGRETIGFEAITLEHDGWERDLDVVEPPDVLPSWEDVVLPAATVSSLKRIAARLALRDRVATEWGFAEAGADDLGLGALFAGPSGTGKTLAAKAMAHESGRELLRVDLTHVVSKDIGETETNLDRVFDEARGLDAIVFFDEADALFGKRTEIRDAHDRYANLEIGYLLQRIEASRGLAILATNLRSNIEAAEARGHSVVRFALPDAAQREVIWRRIFPAKTPVEKLDYRRLARLKLTGAGIRRLAIEAAFRAAEAGQPVSMAHVLDAVKKD